MSETGQNIRDYVIRIGLNAAVFCVIVAVRPIGSKHIAFLERKLTPQLSQHHPAASPITSRFPSARGRSAARSARSRSACRLRCLTCARRRDAMRGTSAMASPRTWAAPQCLAAAPVPDVRTEGAAGAAARETDFVRRDGQSTHRELCAGMATSGATLPDCRPHLTASPSGSVDGGRPNEAGTRRCRHMKDSRSPGSGLLAAAVECANPDESGT